MVIINGTSGNDDLFGESGDDTINGEAGNDTIVGRSGNDSLNGGVGNDSLLGGEGNDTIVGRSGNDTLNGGIGNDSLLGDEGNDTLLTNSGNDTLVGNDGDDVYIIERGAGHITINNLGISAFFGPSFAGLETPNTDIIRFGEGINPEDVSLSFSSQRLRNGLITITVNDPQDPDNPIIIDVIVDRLSSDQDAIHNHLISQLEFDDGTVWGSEEIIDRSGYGYSFVDQGFGSSTRFTDPIRIAGSGGNDSFTIFDSDVLIDGGSGNDSFFFLNNNTFNGGLGSDNYFAEAEGLQLEIVDNNVSSASLNDIDSLFFSGRPLGDLNQSEFALDGNDLLLRALDGGEEIRIRDGALGGGVGIERFFLSGNFLDIDQVLSLVNGTVLARDDNLTTEDGVSVIQSASLLANDLDNHNNQGQVTAVGNANNGSVSFNQQTGEITFVRDPDAVGSASYDYTVTSSTGVSSTATVTLARGNDPRARTDLTSRSGRARNDFLFTSNGNERVEGLEGDDVISTFGGDDLLIGGVGNDTLIGGEGNDTYFFSAGDGSDVIDNSDINGRDIVFFDDNISPEDVSLSLSESGLDLLIQIDSEASEDLIRIENYFASDGSITASAIDAIEFLSDNTLLDQQDITRILSTQDENDSTDNAITEPIVIVGDEADNAIEGASGNDSLQGAQGNDSLDGLAGNDNLDGGTGDDWLSGGAGEDDIFGGSGDDTIIGGADNDFLRGQGGNDVYRFSGDFGQDRIHNLGDYFDRDAIEFTDISLEDIWLSQGGNNQQDLVINIIGTTNQLIIRDWYLDDARQVASIIVGGLNLYTDSVQVLVDAMALQLSSANLELSDIILAGVPVDITEALTPLVNSLFQADYNFESADLLDGSEADDVIESFAGRDRLRGGGGNDWLDSGTGDDNIGGGTGDDTLIGGTGSDLLSGNDGDDVYLFEGDFGQDRINNHGTLFQRDEIQLTDVSIDQIWLSQSGQDLLITIAGSDNQVTVRSWFSQFTTRSVDEITADGFTLHAGDVAALLAAQEATGLSAADVAANGIPEAVLSSLQPVITEVFVPSDELNFRGVDIVTGSDADESFITLAGNDSVRAGAGNDTLDGGAGQDDLIAGAGDDVIIAGEGDNDLLSGGQGNDTYIFSGDFGRDRLDNNGGFDDIDVARFTDDIGANQLWFSQNNSDLEVNVLDLNESGDLVTTSNTVVVRNWFASSSREVDLFEVDGLQLANENVAQLIQALSSFDIPQGAGQVVSQEARDALELAIASPASWQAA